MIEIMGTMKYDLGPPVTIDMKCPFCDKKQKLFAEESKEEPFNVINVSCLLCFKIVGILIFTDKVTFRPTIFELSGS